MAHKPTTNTAAKLNSTMPLAETEAIEGSAASSNRSRGATSPWP
jgi:hypothetical protein